MEKEHVSAVLIAVLAGIRLLYVLLYVILRMLLYSLLIFALLAALHNIGVYETPYIGIYLARVPIEASLVAVGVVLASLGAIGAWRRQKRDELLLVAVEDVWKFFDRASSLLTPVYGHVSLLRKLQRDICENEVPADELVWRAAALAKRATKMQRILDEFHQVALSVYSLDSCHIQALTVHPTLFKSFKSAKVALLELHESAPLLLPQAGESQMQTINSIAAAPSNEYEKFIISFQRLNPLLAGGAGGVKGAAYARFFPPTFTLARAIWNCSNDP